MTVEDRKSLGALELVTPRSNVRRYQKVSTNFQLIDSEAFIDVIVGDISLALKAVDG